MNKFLTMLAASALLLGAAQSASADKKTDLEKCEKEISKLDEGEKAKGECGVLQTLQCVEAGDAACAREGYTSDFVKLHNGVDTNTDIDAAFADGAFTLINIELDINHFVKIDKNTLSIRYVEFVEFTPSALPFPTPFPDVTFVQHEHALVTFDKDGRMSEWDQYGDNKEQTDVDEYAAALIAFLMSLGG